MNTGIELEYKNKIIAVVSALIPEAKIYLFGSRAKFVMLYVNFLFLIALMYWIFIEWMKKCDNIFWSIKLYGKSRYAKYT